MKTSFASFINVSVTLKKVLLVLVLAKEITIVSLRRNVILFTFLTRYRVIVG